MPWNTDAANTAEFFRGIEFRPCGQAGNPPIESIAQSVNRTNRLSTFAHMITQLFQRLSDFFHHLAALFSMNDYLLDHHFEVQWGGARIDFTEVHGLHFEREVVLYRDGSSPSLLTQKIPGPIVFKNIILRRFFKKNDREMYDWWRGADDPGQPSNARDVSIRLLDREHTPVVQWRLTNAFPVRVSYSPLTAQRAQPIIEEVELCFESMVLQGT
jgi:phage tail-like protein